MRKVKAALEHPDAATYVTHGLRKNATIERYQSGCDDERGPDALPKLRGLCEYTVNHGHHYERIEAVAEEPKGVCKYLDLKSQEVRSAVMAATKAAAVFSGPLAKPYPAKAYRMP